MVKTIAVSAATLVVGGLFLLQWAHQLRGRHLNIQLLIYVSITLSAIHTFLLKVEPFADSVFSRGILAMMALGLFLVGVGGTVSLLVVRKRASRRG